MQKLSTQVLVCGGGCAGLTAALAAARTGAQTLLLERAGFAGGIITAVGLPYLDGIAHVRDGRIVARGIPLDLAVRLGICKPTDDKIPIHNPRIDNTERFKILADRLLQAESPRLRVLFHTQAAGVDMQNDRIRQVIAANKDGLVSIAAEVVIDCTGDADIAFWAGAPTTKSQPLQPLTMHFRMGHVQRQQGLSRLCGDECQALQKEGKLKLYYGPGLIFAFADDEVYVHAIRVLADATHAEELTRAEMQGRADAWTLFERWKARVPAFKNAYMISTGPYIGVRETRRLEGEYILTEQDLRQNRRFDDAIATGCWYMDVHDQSSTTGSAQKERGFQPEPYDIPYRSLLPRKVSNLVVAGRCHSADRLALASTRVTVTAMALGQAAGTAAALAVQKKTTPVEFSGVELRKHLESQHAGPIRMS